MGASGDGAGENAYGRLDLVLGKTLRLAGVVVNASLISRTLQSPSVSYLTREDRPAPEESRHDKTSALRARVTVSF